MMTHSVLYLITSCLGAE